MQGAWPLHTARATVCPPSPPAPLQPYLNSLFSKGLHKATAFRTSRLTVARDGLVNYLPTKLYGAVGVLLGRADE